MNSLKDDVKVYLHNNIRLRKGCLNWTKHSYLGMKEITLKPECVVTTDIVNAICDFMSPEVIKRELKNGNEYYKLVRINEFDEIIETVAGSIITSHCGKGTLGVLFVYNK